MSRINTNVQALIAQRVLGQNNFGLDTALTRLSTGLRINRGKDDPAGLIASENLRAEKGALSAAIKNAERADLVVNIAEGGLQEVSNLLTELQGLITTTANSAGLSKEEKEANQLQIDSILQTVDRISDATSFQGTKLLNGSFDYTTTGVAAGVTDFKINGAKLSSGSTLQVDTIVTASAQQAGLFLSTNGNLDLGAATDSFTIEVSGSLGAREFAFASGTSVANIVSAVNSFSDVTGVVATASGTGFRLDSSEFGSSEFVGVKVVDAGSITGTGVGVYDLTATDSGTADTGSTTAFTATAAANGLRDTGQDIGASINGIVATTSGRTAKINTDFLNVDLTFNTATSQALATVNSLTITGGGADFQLASNVDIGGKTSLGLSKVAASKLGNSNTGFLNSLGAGKANNLVDGNLTQAQKVVGEAIKQVASLRGRLGAFQKNTVGASIRSLSVTFENTAAAESAIRDTDFAVETANLTRSQVLAAAATNTLALANSQPQNALRLLG